MNIGKLFNRVAPYFFRNHLFVYCKKECPLPIPIDLDYRIEFPFNISNLTNDELADIQINCETLKARQDEGDLIGVALRRGRVVHRLLLQTKGKVHMEGDPNAFSLARNEMYLHYGYTATDHRGRGILPAMLHRIIMYNSETANAGKIFAACRRENTSSVRGIQRVGFRYLKSSAVLGVLSGKVRLRLWYVDKNMVGDLINAPCAAKLNELKQTNIKTNNG